MQENRFGITPEERERLAGHPSVEPHMDLKMSMLAFACLFLICVLILGASLIARSQVGSTESETGLLPAHTPAETVPEVTEHHRNTEQMEEDTGKPAPTVSEPAPPTKSDQGNSEESALQEHEE